MERRRTTPIRRGWVVGMAVLLVAVVAGTWATHSIRPQQVQVQQGGSSNPDAADRLFRLTNQDRIQHGLEPLDRRDGLDAFALDEAWSIFRKQRLVHSLTGPCWYWGENIGVTAFGPLALDNGFMASTHHRANILNPQFHRIGVAAVEGVYLWVAVEFCR